MPKPEHIEALAQALHASGDCWCESTSPITTEHWTDARMLWVAQAGAVLARITNDPAVQDAVLAALVEGGRLVEERRQPCSCGSESVGPLRIGHLLADAHTSLRERARYVTHWREVPQ